MFDPGIRSKLTSTVSGLCDDRLLEQTGKLARLDHQVHVFLIDHLCEIEARRLYLRRGFSSLFDYVKRGLGYSDAATWRRINAMELCTRIEGVRERLWDGSLALDAAAQMQAAFKRRERERTPEARGTGRGSAVRTNGSPRPASSPSAQGKPAPTLRPGPVPDRSAQKVLVEQATGKSTREVAKLLADVYPALAVPADRVRPLGEGHWELKAVIDADCQRGLEQLRGLLSHIDPRMTLGQLVGRLVKEGLDRHDPGRPPRRRTRTAPTGADRPPAGQGESPDRNRASENNRSTRDAGATTSAPKRTERTGVTSASASKTERDSNRRASSAPKRSAKTDANDVSAPHTEPDSRAGGSKSPGTAGGRAHFGAEEEHSHRSRHAGGGQKRSLAARHGSLPLRRSPHRAPLRVTASAADRSRVSVCPGRRGGAGQLATSVLRSPPRPPRGADFTARAACVIGQSTTAMQETSTRRPLASRATPTVARAGSRSSPKYSR